MKPRLHKQNLRRQVEDRGVAITFVQEQRANRAEQELEQLRVQLRSAPIEPEL